MKIQILAWDKHKHVAELNWLKGFNPIPFDNSRCIKAFFTREQKPFLTHSYLIFATLYKESLHSDGQQFHQYTSK
jgi:hypothetical protein